MLPEILEIFNFKLDKPLARLAFAEIS